MSLIKWLHRDAKWWQFWMPQSGYIGGTILALVIIAVCWIIRSI